MNRTLFGAVLSSFVLTAATLNAASAKDIDVTWIAGNAALQTEHRIRDGFDKYVSDNEIEGWNITYLDSSGAAEKVANNIQDAVSRGSDFIVVTVADLRASESALIDAEKAGIPVFTADSGWIPGVITDVTTNNWQMASEVTLELIGRMKGKGNLYVLTASSIKPVRERTDTLRAILNEYPNIKIIAEHDLNVANFYQDAINATQDAITRFGDEIDAVWAPWDEPAQAAATALRTAGMVDVPVSGMDGHQTAIDAICSEDSNFFVTGRQQFEEWGSMLATNIKRVAEDGEKAEAVKETDIVYLPATLFTKSDCKEQS